VHAPTLGRGFFYLKYPIRDRRAYRSGIGYFKMVFWRIGYNGYMDDGSSELAQSPAPVAEKRRSPFAAIAERFKKKEAPPVKDEWFRGYVEGNVLLPLTVMGSSIKILEQVLNDPPEDFNQLFNSKLSPAQLEQLGMFMSKVHHANNVEYATKPHMNPQDTVVLNNKFQQLWEQASLSAGMIMLNYVNQEKIKDSLMPGAPQYNGSPENKFWFKMQLGEVNKFFRQHPEKLAELKKINDVASATLSSPEGKELSKDYRILISKKPETALSSQFDKIQSQAKLNDVGKLVLPI
jgi:hypothetical protein